MSAKTTLVIVALAAALAQPGESKPQRAIALPPKAEQVATDFLFAFSRNDRDLVKELLPTKLENLYGPSAFALMPKLVNPRADSRVAAIDFKGKMADPALPETGTIILRLVEEDGVRQWRIRQLYWYTDLPPEADIPDQSPTEDDRRQEPAVEEAARRFIADWLAGDYQGMDRRTFHWWEIDRSPPKWVKMTGADLTARPSELNGLQIDFVAKLRVLRVVPKDVRGNVWLVQEDGVWRVRPLTFTFLF